MCMSIRWLPRISDSMWMCAPSRFKWNRALVKRGSVPDWGIGPLGMRFRTLFQAEYGEVVDAGNRDDEATRLGGCPHAGRARSGLDDRWTSSGLSMAIPPWRYSELVPKEERSAEGDHGGDEVEAADLACDLRDQRDQEPKQHGAPGVPHERALPERRVATKLIYVALRAVERKWRATPVY